MNIRECRITLAQAPALLVFRDTPEKAALKGTILLYHGLTSCKEQNRKELTSLAERGFLAVGVDGIGHGERRYPDFDEKFSGSSRESFEVVFLDMVRWTAREVPEVVENLIHRDLADPEKIGITGISMGGYISYAAVLNEPRIKAAAPILGSPRWKSSIDDSPHLHPGRFFPVALLAQNAGKDESVPPQFAREFYEVLKPYYYEDPGRLAYIEYPDSGHFMQEYEWNQLWDRTVDWFERFVG